MERWISSALALLVFVALAAQAQPDGKKGGKARGGGGKNFMQQVDANGDGQIDDAEAEQFAVNRADQFKKQLATIVQKFDANGDGTLDEDEIAKMKNDIGERGGKDPTRFLKRIDKNGDFKVSEEEETAAIKGVIAQVKRAGGGKGAPQKAQAARRRQPDPDTNGDCIVDEQEARTMAERRVEMIRKQLEMFKQRQAQNPEVKMPSFMAMVDTNKDGELSGEEANTVIEQVMKQFEDRNKLVLKIFDDNKDGVLDEVEQIAAKKAFLYASETQQANARRMGQAGRAQRAKGGKARRRKAGGQ